MALVIAFDQQILLVKDNLLVWFLPGSQSTGLLLVIGSLCTVPPGRCDSLCRGKGAGIWHWRPHSCRAADPAAGHIQHVLLRRQGRGDSSLTPDPHTGSPAWAKTEEDTAYEIILKHQNNNTYPVLTLI